MVEAFGALPDHILTQIAGCCSSPHPMLAASTSCRAWRLECERPSLWLALAEEFGLDMPPFCRSRKPEARPLRSVVNLKRTFCTQWVHTKKVHSEMSDRVIGAAYSSFRYKDSAAELHRIIDKVWGSDSSSSHGSSGSSSSASGKRKAGSLTADATSIARRKLWAFNVNTPSTLMEDNTLLNLAARCGCVRTCRHLITKMGADIETTDDGGFTPLLNAVWRGHTVLVKVLLRYGADHNARGASLKTGPFTAREWAEKRPHEDVLQLLKDHAAALDKKAAAAAAAARTDSSSNSSSSSGSSSRKRSSSKKRSSETGDIAADSDATPGIVDLGNAAPAGSRGQSAAGTGDSNDISSSRSSSSRHRRARKAQQS